MKPDHSDEGRFTAKGRGLGTVTEAMVRNRAGEIALISGRSEKNVLQTDLDQARRELTGEERLVPPATPEEELPEEERWDPVSGSTGGKAPTLSAADEQTFSEQLVEEGVEEAEHDQMVDATRESLKRDTEE